MEPQQRGRRGSSHTVMLRSLKSNGIHPGELMSFRTARIVLLSLVILLSIFLFGGDLAARAQTGGLNGCVRAPPGGFMAKAAVRLTNASGASLDPTANRNGF